MSDDSNPQSKPNQPVTYAAADLSSSFGNVPNDSEAFRAIPHPSESFRMVPHSSERSEDHTLTVREVARLFEAANVARSERSIVNWCKENRQGIARLDAYLDPNERRYFITLQSVEAVIAEERAKAAKANAEAPIKVSKTPVNAPMGTEAFRTVPQASESSNDLPSGSGWRRQIEELKAEKNDLEIANRWKDYSIGRLEEERDRMLERLVETSRHVGQLETKLLQLETRAESIERLDTPLNDDAALTK